MLLGRGGGAACCWEWGGGGSKVLGRRGLGVGLIYGLGMAEVEHAGGGGNHW